MGTSRGALVGAVVALFGLGGFVCPPSLPPPLPPPPSPPPPVTEPPPPTTPTDAAALRADCGSVGQACCDDGVCTGRGICIEGLCQRCGVSGAPGCEAGAACDPWLYFNHTTDVCAPCGDVDQLCCGFGEEASDAQCRAPNRMCDPVTVQCVPCVLGADGCVPPPPPPMCNRPGQPPCPGGMVCRPGLVLRGGRCVPCGGSSQPCCANNRCTLRTDACELPRGICVSRTCGRLGQPCCRGSLCTLGRCSAGTCRP